ncbi:MAG: hypothetical protein ACLUAL_00090 [Blautia wexlerae]
MSKESVPLSKRILMKSWSINRREMSYLLYPLKAGWFLSRMKICSLRYCSLRIPASLYESSSKAGKSEENSLLIATRSSGAILRQHIF